MVNAVAIMPDGSRAVSASDDKTLRVWDLAAILGEGAVRERQSYTNAKVLLVFSQGSNDGSDERSRAASLSAVNSQLSTDFTEKQWKEHS